MSEIGQEGYNKFRKKCQTGGASGWAKHCGNTDDHKMSNRKERRLAMEFESDEPGAVGAPAVKRKKIPTRKHLLDRLAHVEIKLEEDRKWREEHRKRKPDCKCYSCTNRWAKKYYGKQKKTILAEFVKYGYEVPAEKGRSEDA